MNADLARKKDGREAEELKLKIGEARTKLDDKVREKVADFESARAQIEDGYNLVREITGHGSLEMATGGTGWYAAIPGTDARAVAGKIDRRSSTLAAANLDKLKGAMSDKDIMFLKQIGANLDRYQDQTEFKKELARVEDVFVRAEKQLRQRTGAPSAKPPANDVRPPGVPAPAGGPQQRNIVVDW